jgi:hypothetical protein
MIPASLRWIVDRNPFYMLSACCGLAACWLLGDVSRPDLADVAMKVAAVFVYEIAVAVLAVWLAKRVTTGRDAAILSVLALTLTADISFFYSLGSLLLAILGHTPAAMQRNADFTWRSLRDVVNAAVPNSRSGWGALLFAAAFLLLGLGAWITWHRQNRGMSEQDR